MRWPTMYKIIFNRKMVFTCLTVFNFYLKIQSKMLKKCIRNPLIKINVAAFRNYYLYANLNKI